MLDVGVEVRLVVHVGEPVCSICEHVRVKHPVEVGAGDVGHAPVAVGLGLSALRTDGADARQLVDTALHVAVHALDHADGVKAADTVALSDALGTGVGGNGGDMVSIGVDVGKAGFNDDAVPAGAWLPGGVGVARTVGFGWIAHESGRVGMEVCGGVGDEVHEPVSERPQVSVHNANGVMVAEDEPLSDALGVHVGDVLGVDVGMGVGVDVNDTVPAAVSLCDAVRVALWVRLVEHEHEPVLVPVAEAIPVDDGLAVSVGMGVGLGVDVGDAVPAAV